jgi:glyoxylase-like metal-dependent hydrolase (beta-lactamase superfamily II)
MNRRDLLRTAVAGAFALSSPRLIRAQQAFNRIADTVAVINGGGANVTAVSTGDALLVVDSGAPKSGDAVMAGLKSFASSAKFSTLFNTHYHLDQTANNEMFAAQGAKIVAQLRTRQWMANDTYVPHEDRYEKARPKAALPTETFLTNGSLKAGREEVQYGYLIMAHTSGDAYYYFKNANVIAVGDVASPLRDPSLDWFTGAFIGGRVDGMDAILAVANDQTKIIPAYGPVMTKAQLKAERDVMEELRARLYKQVREGDGPKDMLEGGVMKGLARTWQDPAKFLYDACKGLWAHHDKLDANVV